MKWLSVMNMLTLIIVKLEAGASMFYEHKLPFDFVLYKGRYTVLPLSVLPYFRPSKIFFVAFFSVTVDGRNLIYGHKRHIGIPYCG